VPIVGTIAAFLLGDRHALRFVRILGIFSGLCGVALLVGRDLASDNPAAWWSVAEGADRGGLLRHSSVLGRTAGLADVPSLGVIAVR
jgi:drug/metabolite transporter (DMT)-like permease